MKPTVGVTGASGHIGNVICRMLCEQGYNVKALYNADFRALENLPLHAVQGNVLNPADLAAFVTGCDIVIHCAGIISIKWRSQREGF